MEKSCDYTPVKLWEKHFLKSGNDLVSSTEQFIRQCNNECNQVICTAKHDLVRFLDHKDLFPDQEEDGAWNE